MQLVKALCFIDISWWCGTGWKKKEKRPTFTELEKDVAVLLTNEGCKVDKDLHSAYF